MKAIPGLQTIKEVGEGTGLVLSIACGIVTRSLGGRMWVEDNEMGGAPTSVVRSPGCQGF